MSFRLGGAKHTDSCYISIVDASTGDELLRFGNTKFEHVGQRKYYYNGRPIDLAEDGKYEANMVLYVADLSTLAGQEVKIKLVDNGVDDWGLLFADDFITYYENAEDVPTGEVAINQLAAA